jgi:hypothetical protein
MLALSSHEREFRDASIAEHERRATASGSNSSAS